MQNAVAAQVLLQNQLLFAHPTPSAHAKASLDYSQRLPQNKCCVCMVNLHILSRRALFVSHTFKVSSRACSYRKLAGIYLNCQLDNKLLNHLGDMPLGFIMIRLIEVGKPATHFRQFHSLGLDLSLYKKKLGLSTSMHPQPCPMSSLPFWTLPGNSRYTCHYYSNRKVTSTWTTLTIQFNIQYF